MSKGNDAPAASGISPAAWQSWLPRIYKTYAAAVAICLAGAFAESFRNLVAYFARNGYPGLYAYIAPVMIDIFTIAGEGLILLATLNHWDRRAKIAGWAATGVGLALSVAGNVGRDGWSVAPAHAGPFSVPPLALAGLLALGLMIVKRALAPAVSEAEADEKLRRAIIEFRADLTAGQVPAIAPIKKQVGVGQAEATRIQRDLAPLAEVAPLLAGPHLADERDRPAA